MSNFTDLIQIMRRLRASDGCPWDREQTYASLAPYLLEETYETFDAIQEAVHGEPENLREELGDLLLQIVFHAQIAEEASDFTISDVIAGVSRKMILRHPHVFGETRLETAADVVQNWDALKAAERSAAGKTEKPKNSILDDVPAAFPALLEAQKLTKKAAKIGFDWERAEQIFDKLQEEVEELREAMREQSAAKIAEEIGDLLFAAVNLARHTETDAETALKLTNRKFRRRFAFIERELKANGKSLSDATLSEMDALWNRAKHENLED